MQLHPFEMPVPSAIVLIQHMIMHETLKPCEPCEDARIPSLSSFPCSVIQSTYHTTLIPFEAGPPIHPTSSDPPSSYQLRHRRVHESLHFEPSLRCLHDASLLQRAAFPVSAPKFLPAKCYSPQRLLHNLFGDRPAIRGIADRLHPGLGGVSIHRVRDGRCVFLTWISSSG